MNEPERTRNASQFHPFMTAVPLWGQSTQISSSLSPKRDCGSKGVKNDLRSRKVFCPQAATATRAARPSATPLCGVCRGVVLRSRCPSVVGQAEMAESLFSCVAVMISGEQKTPHRRGTPFTEARARYERERPAASTLRDKQVAASVGRCHDATRP